MLIHETATGQRRSASVPLVWHKGRRRASDPAHMTARIVEGLCTGAGVGIDIHPMSDGHFAVLRGPLLDGETTGSGPVTRARAADLARLRRRAEDGTTTEEPPTTLAALMAAIGPGARGLLHIRLRCGDEALRPGHEVGFARALGPMAGRALLSGGDVMALRRLGATLPGLRLGFALANETAEWLRRTGDAEAFAARVIEAMPEAGTIHLTGSTILALDDEDIDLVGAFKAGGWQVEAQVEGGTEAGLWDVLRLLSLGVDRIASDDAEGLLAALAEHRHPAGHPGRPADLRTEADDWPPEPDWEPSQPRTAA